MTLRVLVADDEMLARRRLVRLLAALEGIEVVAECASGEEALSRIASGGVDLALFDINMPGLSGIDAKALLGEGGPHVIFATAHPEHAVSAFDVGASDYILKPIDAQRLSKAIERARKLLVDRAKEADAAEPADDAGAPAAPIGRLAIPTRKGVVLIDPADVTHAVLEDELVTVHTLKGAFLTDFTLQELEGRLPAGRFERVHRRALLNLERVERLEPLDTGGYVARTVTGLDVEVSRQSARRLRRRLGLARGTGDE
ncbi:MAG: response regulator transcription factor [Deltaproteobacteria bacterium]|nr:response regulator transcription factor [Deltaproteobacteria bacterium]